VRPKGLNAIADFREKHHFATIAVVINMYLGSSDAPQSREAGGKLQYAKSPNAAHIKSLIADQDRIATVDRFLKTLAMSYKYSEGVVVKKLIIARGSLFYRAGRMLMNAWPPSPFHVDKMFAGTEEKFVHDLKQAGMIISVPVQYPQPAVIHTVEPKAKAAKRVASDAGCSSTGTAVVAKKAKAAAKQQKGAIVVMAMQRGSDADGKEDDADDKEDTADGKKHDADGKKGDADGKKGDAEGMDGDDDGKEDTADGKDASCVQLPHTLPADLFTAQTHRCWNSFEGEVTRALATSAMVHTYLAQPLGVDATEVANMQQPDYTVWQVRATKAMGTGELVLVPSSKVPRVSMADEDKDPKRPSTVHPNLVAFVKIGVVNESIVDAKTVLATSPLAKRTGDAPAAFWCVVGVADPEVANMATKTVDAVVPVNSIAARVRIWGKSEARTKAAPLRRPL